MLNKRTWLTTQNEVLTDIGWLDIEKIFKARFLMGPNEYGEIVRTDIKQVNFIRNHSTKVLQRFAGIYLHAKNVNFYNNCIWRVDTCEDIPEIKKQPYSGDLINIVTGTNTFIFRSHKKNLLHNDDYITAVCLVK